MSSLDYPTPAGEHYVGVFEGELTDTTHPPVRASEESGRRLSIRVWYPAASGHGPRRRYLSDAEIAHCGAWMTGDAPGRLPQSWVQRLGGIETHSHIDAPVAPGRFPTLVFSHGGGGFLSQNTTLMEHLASNGYVVIGLGHPGESGALEYPSGDLAHLAPDFSEALTSFATDPATMNRHSADPAQRLDAARSTLDKALGPWLRRWVHDIRSLLDTLESGSVTGLSPALLAACDLERIGTVGMSFGGAASTCAAQADRRVKAVVSLDGGEFLSDLLDTDIRLPLLELSSDLSGVMRSMGLDSHLITYNEFFYEPHASVGTREDIVRLRLPSAAHLEMTDLVLIPRGERAAIPGGGSVEGTRVVAIINTLIQAHFDAHLKEASNGYPKAQRDEFPELVAPDLGPLRDWALHRLD